ncbi:zinc-binding alcohol dehydrogenase family protein [Devosia sp. XJ19-1]|uniref:Zinc-binding alcohol dehydrogenase family protein n=1 Tax=Devosia ureilytica TaxID=2952754 RepID=A0A9Q4AS76_9HYPH|nr:zinc-binding alcohol dehydrogenase family protein [Devosia ureilytica]MCP8885198.1 zinc-binding alcohol dehydrogenase family protein [Devosia ureilytica]MCP8888920.1 zinc-binding alcohol dehydrogenase family protein [Devosia ureilytica]
MKAVRLTAPNAISIGDVPVPDAAAGDVVIDVAFVGYCGSDLTSFRGLNPLVSYPRVPGHEIAGVVAALGADVDDLSIGAQVTVLPYFNCGNCRACRLGRPNACVNNQTMGVQREGAMTARIVVPRSKVMPTPGLRLRDAALVEPCAVGFHAVSRADVAAGETVVVLGCGMIGLGALMGSLRRGAKVIAVDLSPKKLDIAKSLGAHHVILGGDGAAERIAELVPEGPDVVIEAVGAPATFLLAVEAVGQCGRVVYIGYAKQAIAFDTKQFITKEIDIRGSRNALHADFADVQDWLRARPDVGDLIVSATVPLDEAPAALERWAQDPGGYTKILVSLEEA